MMNYVRTSIFDSPAQTIVNTVNTVGVMGKGIAAEYKRRYPAMYERYREVCKARQLDVGMLWLHATPNKWVLNFPTKKDWRQPSRIEWIESGLRKFVASYTDRGITSISFPMLGCGNGGLDWKDVRPLMERYLRTLPIPVYVHLSREAGDEAPEHRRPSAVAADRDAREMVTFLTFWNELRRAVNAPPLAQLSSEPDVTDDTLPLRLAGSRTVSLPQSAFEDLFHMLCMKGAVRLEEYPPELQTHDDEVTQLLLELPYIKPIEFADLSAPDRESGRGIRFAPRPRPTMAPGEVLATETA